jgi:hypothetical protein
MKWFEIASRSIQGMEAIKPALLLASGFVDAVPHLLAIPCDGRLAVYRQTDYGQPHLKAASGKPVVVGIRERLRRIDNDPVALEFHGIDVHP